MPLYTIKHLKAPWPAGARIGDVIEFAALPAWAAGKCELGGTQATVFAEQYLDGDGSGAALGPIDPDQGKIDAALAAVEEQARQEREVAHKRALDELEERVRAAEQALAAAKADLEASLGREANLQAQLTASEQALAAAKVESKAEGKMAKK